MKHVPAALLCVLLPVLASGCVYVSATGNLEHLFSEADDDEDSTGFNDLSQALEGCVTDPAYDLDVTACPWRARADWTVRYRSEGSDDHAAFRRAREAVLARIDRKDGTVTEERNEGPHEWSCDFRIHDEPGEASVRLRDDAPSDDGRERQLLVHWKQSN